jgi:hypothetical protein
MMLDAASAADVHLKGGKNAEPTYEDKGFVFAAIGELSGLGGDNVEIKIDAEANVVSTCTNQGGNQAPGQNPASITVTGSISLSVEEIKNGNTDFAVETESPDPAMLEPIDGAPGCPNENWTEQVTDFAFTSATITVQQPVGTVVLVVKCTIDPPSADGEVPKGDVSCTQLQSRKLRGRL